jgi:hypothetical protein
MVRLAFYLSPLLFFIHPTLWLLSRHPGGRVAVRSWAREGPLSEADYSSAKGVELEQADAFMKCSNESRLALSLSLSRFHVQAP